MLNPVGRTARWVAAVRAVETESEKPLFRDPYARALAGEEGFEILRDSAKNMPGGDGSVFQVSLAIRTRFFDDSIQAAVADGIRQIVILAAGMDARAFRMVFPPGTKIWELDQPEMLEMKQKVLEPMRPKTGATRHAIAVDLREDWRQALLDSGFDPSQRAYFLVEGLLIYLEAEQVEVLLDRIGSVAAPGSLIGADIAGTELLEFPMIEPVKQWLQDLGAPWKFATKDPEALFESHGWKPKVSCIGDPDASYGKWPLPPIDRSVPGIPRSYFIVARKV